MSCKWSVQVVHRRLFQAAFSFVNVPQSRTELPGLSLEFMEIDHQAAQFDITLFMEEADGVLIGRFEYNTDLFDASTIERMSGHLQTLLAGVVEAPEQTIGTLPLLTEAERHQVLYEWNQRKRRIRRILVCINLFEYR